MTEIAIRVTEATVRYGDVTALDGFSVDVPVGGLVALVGPSGCGKTTALRAIAGFENLDAGSITIRDAVVSGATVHVPPEQRKVGMVFQEFALFPHISVAENVGYGVSGADRIHRVGDALRTVDLEDLADRYPHELSGGEQQRVAIARALAPSPDVILLDEPFSNLDAPQRDKMRRELRHIVRRTGVTAVFVTHDQAEALAIADFIAVMRDGSVKQAGPPDEVYARPASPWVATFLGDAMLFDGVVSDGHVTTDIGVVKTELADGSKAQVMVRPEWVMPSTSGTAQCTVTDREFYGHDQLLEITLPTGGVVESLISGRHPVRLGDKVDIDITDAIVFEAV